MRAVYADGGNASFAVLVTTIMRAMTLYLFCLFTRKPLFATRGDKMLALRGGFFQALSIIAMIWSLVWLPGPVGITIAFTHTLMLLFFMAWRGEAKLDAATLLSTLAAFGGLTLVLDVWRVEQALSPVGISLAFVSALATMSRLYVFGHMTRARNPAVVGAETFLVVAAFVFLLMLFKAPQAPSSLAGWGWVLAGGASLSAGTFTMFYSISLVGAFKYSLLNKIEPVFTALFSVTLIDETLNWTQYIGILAVTGSLAFYQYYENMKKL